MTVGVNRLANKRKLQSRGNGLHWEFGIPNLDRDHTERKHGHCILDQYCPREWQNSLTEDNDIPPFWNLRVDGHQAGMDIRLLVHGTAGLSPDLLSEIQATETSAPEGLGYCQDSYNACVSVAVIDANERP